MTVYVKLVGAQLVLTSSSRAGVHTDGRATVTEGPEGIVVTERLPADELHPICRVQVPTGTIVDAQIERGNLRVFSFEGTLRARLHRGAAKLDHAEGRFRIITDEGAIEFEQMRGVLDILTTSGRVTARHIHGDVQAVSQAGSMEFEAINGPMVARSITGTLKASDLNGMARLSTRSGAVQVSSAYRQLIVRTLSGDISLNGSVVDHTRLETTRGSIDVRLGSYTDARIEAVARQGVVRSERLMLASGSGRNKVRSSVGKGRARLRVETGMGVVEVAGPMRSRTELFV
jgi:hypothetical protein